MVEFKMDLTVIAVNRNGTKEQTYYLYADMFDLCQYLSHVLNDSFYKDIYIYCSATADELLHFYK